MREISYFYNDIMKGDVILLYIKGFVYYGHAIVSKRGGVYYYVKPKDEDDYFYNPDDLDNRAPHRVAVQWDDNQRHPADFSMWVDTVHRVTSRDLFNILDVELRADLELQLSD